MLGWHYGLNGHEFEKVLGDGEGQGSLAFCSPWGHKESETIDRLNNINSLVTIREEVKAQPIPSVILYCVYNKEKPTETG